VHAGIFAITTPEAVAMVPVPILVMIAEIQLKITSAGGCFPYNCNDSYTFFSPICIFFLNLFQLGAKAFVIFHKQGKKLLVAFTLNLSVSHKRTYFGIPELHFKFAQLFRQNIEPFSEIIAYFWLQ